MIINLSVHKANKVAVSQRDISIDTDNIEYVVGLATGYSLVSIKDTFSSQEKLFEVSNSISQIQALATDNSLISVSSQRSNGSLHNNSVQTLISLAKIYSITSTSGSSSQINYIASASNRIFVIDESYSSIIGRINSQNYEDFEMYDLEIITRERLNANLVRMGLNKGAISSVTYDSSKNESTLFVDEGEGFKAKVIVVKGQLISTTVSSGPVANFTCKVQTSSPRSVSFDGSSSVNNDGVGGTLDLEFQWDFGDGTVSAFTVGNASPIHTYSVNGTYTVTLTVRDSLGNTASISKEVTVAENPVAIQTAPNVTGAGVIALNGEQSYAFDSDGEEDQYEWTILDDNGDTLTTTGFIDKDIDLGVSWASGLAQNPSLNISHIYENFLCTDAPSAAFASASGSGAGQVDFDASTSDGNGEAISNYDWTIYSDDGLSVISQQSGQNASFTFPKNAIYPVVLKASSASGVSIHYEYVDVSSVASITSQITRTEYFTITTLNQIPNVLTNLPDDVSNIVLEVNGMRYGTIGLNAPVSAVVDQVYWNALKAGFDLLPGQGIFIEYTTLI